MSPRTMRNIHHMEEKDVDFPMVFWKSVVATDVDYVEFFKEVGGDITTISEVRTKCRLQFFRLAVNSSHGHKMR